MINSPLFGPAGNCELFYSKGYERSEQMPLFLAQMGLTAYEYQCGRGVRIGENTARRLGEQAKQRSVALSVHAPYYINLATQDERRQKSIDYILASAAAAKSMGAGRVIAHCGACAKIDRQLAMAMAEETLSMCVAQMNELGLEGVEICPETMGKINQLGTVEEVLRLCLIAECLVPTIDVGHVYSRMRGQLDGEGMLRILERMISELGFERAKKFHCHFSKQEYTAGGEKKHLTFADQNAGPDYKDFLCAVKQLGLVPVIICESAGTQTEDAHTMLEYWSLINEGENHNQGAQV